jgi:hypothetical protein
VKVNKNIGHAQARVKEYPSVGEQLDKIVKTFDYLHQQGVDIGPDGRQLVEDCQSVKNKFKKPDQ